VKASPINLLKTEADLRSAGISSRPFIFGPQINLLVFVFSALVGTAPGRGESQPERCAAP
jgi:hypothetical protein